LEFYAQVLIQKYAWIGISTDFGLFQDISIYRIRVNLVRWHTPEEIHLDIQRHALDTHKKKIEDKSQAAASRQTDPNQAIDINRKALSFLIARLEASKRQLDACDQAPAGAPSVTTQLSRNAEEFIRLAHTSPQELIRLEATNPEKFGQLMAAVSADALTLRVNPDSADLVRLNNAAWQYRQEKFKILREQCDVLAQGQYNPLLMLDALETSTGLVMFDEQSRQDGDPQAQLRSMMVLKMLNQTPLQEFLHAQPAREYTLPPITPDASFQDLIARQNYLQASGIMDRLDGEAAAACAKLLIHDGPHVIKGTAKGAAKAFNPVNLARGAYAMAKQTSAAAGFVLLQAARLETAQELAAKHPEQAQAILEQYNAANDAVVEGAIQIGRDFAAQISTMSREERIEFISETLAEFALTKSSTKFWLAATGKALNAAGKGVRKIAQVVEAETVGKPKAIAATPEGVMLDATEVLEAEANPIAEIAKLQEGPAVEGKAAAQGVQVAEDAEALTAKPKALKNPEQVVAQQNRHIHGARLKIEKLQNYFRQKIACVENPEFESANLEHIFGADKLVKERAGGAIDAKYSGLHHDKGWKLVKKGKIEFLSEAKVDPKTGAIKVERLTIEGKLIKDKTFFPAEWSRRKVIDKIIEASQNIVETVKKGITCDEVIGVTEEGMEILLVIRRSDKFLITAYPYMKGF